MMRFDGKTALITGAGRGIGREHALFLASRGAHVIVNDYGGDRQGRKGGNSEPAEIVAQEIRSTGGSAIPACVDITDAGAVRAMVADAVAESGGVHIVIHNASVYADPGPFADAGLDDLRRIMMVNAEGGWNVAQATWPHMIAQDYGRIIMTGSGAGFFGRRLDHAYSVAKSALIGFTKLLATEGAEAGIKANMIGPIAWTENSSAQGIPPIMEKYASPVLVSNLVALLAHEKCPVSGEMFHVGGGFVSRIFMAETQGTAFRAEDMSPESVLDRMEVIMAEPGYSIPANSDRSGALVSRAIASVNPEFADILAQAKAERDARRASS
ncbi:MAG: SDR family NAD(P)-dependent oxidoreductase [Sphingomonadaceae bacterium]